jgi:hypothetical protein
VFVFQKDSTIEGIHLVLQAGKGGFDQEWSRLRLFPKERLKIDPISSR